MRVIIPTNQNDGLLSSRGAHFGKAKFYTVVTLDGNDIKDVEVVQNQGHSAGACGGAVSNIMSLNPDALIVGGIGQNPALGFAKVGLKVYFDGESSLVQDSIKAFLDDKLQSVVKGTCSV